MNSQHYTAAFSVAQSPAEVFAAVTNPRAWWSEEIEGPTDRLGAEFEYHYQDIHRARFRITEVVPDTKVVWHVLANEFNFVKDKAEWTGTDVVFEIAKQGDGTELRFTHVGLTPAYDCYDVCSDAWGAYVRGSLRDLIATGKGTPNPITGNLDGVLEEVAWRAREMSRAV
jgi:uncharacterized protein YndB with AHSA1/START domain